MFLNYLKIAWRNLIRQKVYTLITVVGLALAMAACILIFLFIRHEFSYDQYHEHADSIYRLNWWLTTGDQKRGYAILPSNIGPPISEVLPEVVRSVRVCEPYAGSESAIRVNSHLFEQKIVLTDPALFDMFTIRSLSGHPRQALQDPSSIVITQKVAEKYFPGINPIGKKIGVKTPFQAFVEFRVGAVIEDLPTNTHLAFDILIPFAVLPKFSQGYALTQFELVFTYLQLRPGDPPETVEHKFPEFFKTHLKHRNVEPGKYFLEPLTDLHFSPGYFGDVGDRSSPQYSYYLVLLAGFILAVAAINFVVLTTARSLSRTREVGTRKVLGAHRRQIVGQFLTETMVLGILSGVLGLFLCEVLLPSFNAFLGRRLTLNLWGDGVLFLYLLGLVGLVSLMVGTYPAFFLASFRTAAILKGTWFTRLTGSGLRKVLVVVQFGLAILFITGTLILVKQLHYIQHKDLGFDPENLVYTYVYKMTPSPEPFIQALRQNPNIVGVSLCGSTPGEKAVFQDVMPTGAGEGQALPMPIIPVGLDYFETIGMELLAGRTFSRSHPSDPDKAVVLNQSAVQALGWKSPVGKRLRIDDDYYIGSDPKTVVGVVEDIHYASLHQTIPPEVYFYSTAYQPRALIRLRGTDVTGTLAFIEQQWQHFVPDDLFKSYFVEDRIARQYTAEWNAARAVETMAILLVFLSCLGLFGLAHFSVQKRTKEIGIRKVLGASLSQIVAVISNEFVRWILAANLIAWPVVYVLANKWLQNFAYHINLGPGVFLLGGSITLLIALVSICAPVLKTAQTNPAETLRYE